MNKLPTLVHQNLKGLASELNPTDKYLLECLIMLYRNHGMATVYEFISLYQVRKPNKSLTEKIKLKMNTISTKFSKSLKSTKIGKYVSMNFFDYKLKQMINGK